MPKYRDYFRQMLAENEEVFTKFKELHDKYQTDQSLWQGDYNAKGAPVVEIIREWERKLCGHMEKGNHAMYSSKLADKFWDEVRAFFPLIDYVGIKISRS